MSDEKLPERLPSLPARSDFNNSLAQVDAVVFKRYLEVLSQCPVIKAEPVVPSEMAKRIRLNKLSKLVYDKEEDRLDKLNGAIAAMHGTGASLLVVIQSDGEKTDLYLGVRASEASTVDSANKTLVNALQAGFPGIRMCDPQSPKEAARLLESIRKAGCIAGVTGVPSLKDKDKKLFVQGIEKIIDGMNGQCYTALLIADPVTRRELDASEAGYHQLYSTLSMLAENQITLSENESRSIGTNWSQAFSKTLTDSLTDSQTTTTGTNSSTTKTRSPGAAVAAGAGLAGAAIGTIILPGVGTMIGSSIGGLVGGVVSSVMGSNSTTTGTNESEAKGTSRARSRANGLSDGKGGSDQVTDGTGKSVQFTVKNRRLMEILKLIDEQLERIRECKNYGLWNWGAYFVGNDLPIVKMGAHLYSGILRGEATGIEASAINVWDTDLGTTAVEKADSRIKCEAARAYLSQMQHPVMAMPEGFPIAAASVCSLVSTPELCVGMSLPQKSIPGIPVMEAIGFGRAVSCVDKAPDAQARLHLGNIMHLGRIEKAHRVELLKDLLTAHTFVTGSTGAGKSNTVYHLLSSLWDEGRDGGIPFLIIEPAKGEYKKVFGWKEGVNVFGTNPAITPLLRINPFAFSEKCHVVEHIDRLIEILNAVWPMYAAMPAILKEAVECAYRNMGWNLLSSKCKYTTPVFPDFEDLLDVLPGIIGASDYSQEMKGNYAGALLTRVRSLTNGYFRSIFQKDEIVGEVLFDKPCIVDLSRVGSSETKSLLMGVVFLKLQEYRMANAASANSGLKHITVLEEAHNLLRRSSPQQSQEGANLQGKSVEMISNAIAEMRTYGEAFVIADQAPGLLDQSVIRNTNTKIIHRLPDWEDRELVGKAANLKDEQLVELARLPTGCAAVYQNNWLEAVLCQVAAFSAEERDYVMQPDSSPVCDARKQARTQLVSLLLEARLSGRAAAEIALERKDPIESFTPYFATIVDAITTGKDSKEWLLSHIRDVLHVRTVIGTLKEKEGKRWIKKLLKGISEQVEVNLLTENERVGLVSAVFDILAREQPGQRETWLSIIGQAEQWKGVLA
jgi:hypothetical protein